MQHDREDVAGKDISFGTAAVSLPTDEVLGSFRIDGIAGNLDRRNIETGCIQRAAKEDYEFRVARTGECRFHQALARTRKCVCQSATAVGWLVGYSVFCHHAL
ncbi:hypothetical protein [Rhizobium sp. A37_96]